jgi:nicotinamide riboside kinase
MKVAMSGCGGTGKSTLVHAMVEKWPNHFSNLEIIDTVRHPNHMNMSKTERQKFFNKEYRKNQLGDNFISARSIYDVYAYSRRILEMKTEWVQWQGAIYKMKPYDHLFYIPREFEPEPNEDGTRPLDSKEVEEFERELQIILNFYHVPVQFLSGTVEQRLQQIAHHMDLKWQ